MQNNCHGAFFFDNPFVNFLGTICPELPWQAQAVIVSIQYQRGVNSPYKYPNTWAALVRRDWADAARRLKTGAFWSGYQQRRAREGALLEELC